MNPFHGGNAGWNPSFEAAPFAGEHHVRFLSTIGRAADVLLETQALHRRKRKFPMGFPFERLNNPEQAIGTLTQAAPVLGKRVPNESAASILRARGENARVLLESSYSERSIPVQRCIWFQPAPLLPSTAFVFQLPSISRSRSRRLLRRSAENTACGPRKLGFRLS